MATTFLEGVQALAVECGLPSSPSSVANQTGEYARLVNWYRDAWIDIQNRKRWKWMRRQFFLNLSNSATDLTRMRYEYSSATDNTESSTFTISRFSEWRFNDCVSIPQLYTVSSGVYQDLHFVDWESFKDLYPIYNITTGTPVYISTDPLNRIHFGPTPAYQGAPDTTVYYKLYGDYYKSAQKLEIDGDELEIDDQFAKIIVYRAMQDYGYFESAIEVIERGNVNYARMLKQLERTQSEPFLMAGPLA